MAFGKSIGQSFATAFNPAFKESYKFTSAELAEDKKEKKRKTRLKRAGDAKFEAILEMVSPKVVTEVASTLPASKDTGADLIPVLDDAPSRIRQAIASQKGKMGKAAMQSAITSKLLSRDSVAQGIKDWESAADRTERRGKMKKDEADLKILNEWNETNRLDQKPAVSEGERGPLNPIPSLAETTAAAGRPPQNIEDGRTLKEGGPRKLHGIPVQPQMPSNINDYVDNGYIDEDGRYTMKWLKRLGGDRDNMMMFKELTEHYGRFPEINSLGTAKMRGNHSNMLKRVNQKMTNEDKSMLLIMQGISLGQITPADLSEEEYEKYMRATNLDKSNTPVENEQAKRLMSAHDLWQKGNELEKYARERATGEVDQRRKAEIKKIYSDAALRSSETSSKKQDGVPVWILTPAQNQTTDGLVVTVMVPRYHPEYSPTDEDIKAANKKANDLYKTINALGDAPAGREGSMDFQNKDGAGANTVKYKRFQNTK